MKKMFIGVIFSLVFSMASLPILAAGNATLDFSSLTYSLAAGDSFDVVIRANPNGNLIDTVRTVVSYDANTLKAESVSLIGAWNRLAPGNSVDQNKGLISWGGFSTKGSVKSAQGFIRITFFALKEGKSDIKILPDSHLLDGGEDRTDISKLSVSKINIAAPIVSDPSNEIFTVESSSHPNDNQWFKEKDVTVSWVERPNDNPAVLLYTAFDSASDTNPQTQQSTKETSTQFKQVSDGVHYFHLKAKRKDGTFTKIIHRRFGVDATIPNPFEITVASEKIIEGESVWITFATTDDISGIADYQASINTSKFQSGQTSPLEITDLKKGTYFIRIAALDRAGNTMYASKSVRVYPKGTNMERPEGFATTDEVNTLLEKGKQITNSITKNKYFLLLITFVLVVLAGFGIIYALKIKKRNN